MQLKVMPRMPFGWLIESASLGPVRLHTRALLRHARHWAVCGTAYQLLAGQPDGLLKREHQRLIGGSHSSLRSSLRSKDWSAPLAIRGCNGGTVPAFGAWLREFFAAENALIIDAGPVTAFAERGFSCGQRTAAAAIRQRAFPSGAETTANPRFRWGDAGWVVPPPEDRRWFWSRVPLRLLPKRLLRVRALMLRRRWQSGKWTVIDGPRLLFYWPRPYIVLVLMLPALLGGAIALIGFG